MSKTRGTEQPTLDLAAGEPGADFTAVVVADDVVSALMAQHVYDRSEFGTEVVTIQPPFDGECDAEQQFRRHGEAVETAAGEPDVLDIEPSLFVSDDSEASFPTWEATREAMREEGVELTDENEWEWYEERKAEWASTVRNALLETVAVSRGGTMRSVSVRYK